MTIFRPFLAFLRHHLWYLPLWSLCHSVEVKGFAPSGFHFWPVVWIISHQSVKHLLGRAREFRSRGSGSSLLPTDYWLLMLYCSCTSETSCICRRQFNCSCMYEYEGQVDSIAVSLSSNSIQYQTARSKYLFWYRDEGLVEGQGPICFSDGHYSHMSLLSLFTCASLTGSQALQYVHKIHRDEYLFSMYNLSESLNNCSRWSHIYAQFVLCTSVHRKFYLCNVVHAGSPNHEYLLYIYILTSVKHNMCVCRFCWLDLKYRVGNFQRCWIQTTPMGSAWVFWNWKCAKLLVQCQHKQSQQKQAQE